MNAFNPIFGKMIKELGFKQRTRRLFFLEKEDVIAFFCVECPSSMIYVQFGIIPKYLPPKPGILYFNYGNRMCEMYPYPYFRDLKKSDSEEKMRLWCQTARQYILRDLMPLIESLSTVSGIHQYILYLMNESRRMCYQRDMNIYRTPIFCMDSDLQYLLIYSDLYLHHIKDAEKDAAVYNLLLEETPLMPSLKEERRLEIQHLLDIAEDTEKLQALFADWRTENRGYFVK